MHPILAPVGFVSDDDDIFPVRKEGIFLLVIIFREEFLDGGEHDSTRGNTEQGFEILPVFCLNRGLAKEFFAPGKSPEELIIKIVPVRDHQDGGVLQ